MLTDLAFIERNSRREMMASLEETSLIYPRRRVCRSELADHLGRRLCDDACEFDWSDSGFSAAGKDGLHRHGLTSICTGIR